MQVLELRAGMALLPHLARLQQIGLLPMIPLPIRMLCTLVLVTLIVFGWDIHSAVQSLAVGVGAGMLGWRGSS